MWGAGNGWTGSSTTEKRCAAGHRSKSNGDRKGELHEGGKRGNGRQETIQQGRDDRDTVLYCTC